MDRQSLTHLPKSAVVVYAIGYDRTCPASKREVYVQGLKNVLEVCGERFARFVYVSSSSVYGQNQGEFVDESTVAEPTSLDGRICREAEEIVWQFFPQAVTSHPIAVHATTGGLPNDERSAIVLRLSGIYGPGRIAARIDQLRQGAPLSGNPNAWLNLIHVDDAVQAVVAAAIRGRPGTTYLVSDDRPVIRRDFYSQLTERIGAPLPQFQVLESSASEASHINKRCVNRLLKEDLKVELRYPTITEGLSSLPEVQQSWGRGQCE